MANFVLTLELPDGNVAKLHYDSFNSTLATEEGVAIVPPHIESHGENLERTRRTKLKAPVGLTHHATPDSPGHKAKGKISRLKIQLGLACNYSCDYCLQAHVNHDTSTTVKDVDPFIASLDWVSDNPDFDGDGLYVEFRGGEPFVYWKTLKPLAEKLRLKWPKATYFICTNGSMIDDEKIDWLDQLGFSVAVSHDGPGQHVRGPDPLDDPKQREALLKLYWRLKPQGRMSFNSMMNKSNNSRAAVIEFFKRVTGDEAVVVGEGTLIDAYDDGGIGVSLDDGSAIEYRRQAFAEGLADLGMKNMPVVASKVVDFLNSLATGRKAETLGQKCGMDRSDYIAVDLKGNVTTCQNLTTAEVGMNGNSHKIGHVSDFDNIKLDTVKHWSARDNCKKCPVVQLCKGSCMYLDGPLFEHSCQNSYSDNVVFFALAIHAITGGKLVRIDGDFPEERKDVFGQVQTTKLRKIIPIRPA